MVFSCCKFWTGLLTAAVPVGSMSIVLQYQQLCQCFWQAENIYNDEETEATPATELES